MIEKVAEMLCVPPRRIKEEFRTLLVTTLGTAMYCAGTVFFVKQALLPSGGVLGVCLLLNYRLGIPLGLSNAVFNLALFVFAYKVLPKRFLVWTLYSVMMMSLFMELFEMFPKPVIDDRMLLVVVTGVIYGLAGATVFSGGGSTGGIDIISMALRQKYGIELGNASRYMNFCVILLFITSVPLVNVIYGFLLTYISSLVMNGDLRAFSQRKEAMIITNQTEVVRNYIVYTLHRGVTIFRARGGFNAQPRDVLLTLITPRQEASLKIFLREHDPTAFMRVAIASEVLGKGFQRWEE